MIGNDVVDLDEARKESNWQRKGWLEKLFCEEEQKFIHAQQDPEITAWVLWSMKEAAYKIYNRETGVRAFMPQRLVCSNIIKSGTGFDGVVTCDSIAYFTSTTIEGAVIHTVAVKDEQDQARISELKPGAILKNNEGIPYIYDANSVKIPVSVSHHGRCHKVVRLI